MTKTYEQKGLKSSRYIGMLTLSPDIRIIISAIATLERDLISERVRKLDTTSAAEMSKSGHLFLLSDRYDNYSIAS